MNERGILTELAIQFALISLVSIGGAAAVLPEMHRAVVDVHGWMSSETFANLFALAQAAPGPNVIVVTLIGWHVAGVPGALVATTAMTGPAFIVAYGAAQVWERWHRVQWYKTFERGVVPITVGLIAASGWLLTSASGFSLVNYLITAATVACVLFTRINPLIALSGAALLGLTGMI
ncbi:chromate transporter [Microvirga sp. KLBC 81]|uniref:chromate transporter n=1 Tax=Microvirga sp. KLBC 81 TaxID=1862707 RepID=UPI000D5173E6|nr:chromate transporter [Microvirga sp. KLBC 81]PVE24889.1 chromate transporter [Microvirga sp. KLBC 81]